MKTLRFLAVSVMVGVALLLGIQSTSHAVSLYLEDLSTSTSVTVNGAGGFVNYTGALGNWAVNVTTGITYPILGDQLNANMDLNSVNVTSSGPASLLIKLSEINYIINSPVDTTLSYKLDAGGTTDGAVTFQGWADDWNWLFYVGEIDLFGILGPYGPGAFSFTANGGGIFNPSDDGGLYSLTLIAQIDHTKAGQVTSFDVELNRVPEPGILILLGIGLSAVGVFSRRIKF